MWLCLVGLHFTTTFHRVSFNVVADRLMAEFTLTGAGLGNLAAAYTYMYVLMQIPGGMLIDRFGPRLLALFTGLLMAAGSLLIGFATGAGQVFVGRLLIGLGGAVVLINIFKFQAAWFSPRQFATMSGLAVLLSGCGALLGGMPLALTAAALGWRNAFVLVGGGTVLLALFSYLVIVNEPPQRGEKLLRKPAEKPLLQKAPPVGESAAPHLSSTLAVLGNRGLWIPFLINFGTFSGFIVFSGTWGVSYLVHVLGLTVERASPLMMLSYLGYMLGAASMGWVSDRLGSLRRPTLCLVGCCVFFWVFLAAWPGSAPPLSILTILSFLLGWGSSCAILSFPMARLVSAPGHTGLVTATVNLGVFLGLAILQPLFGFVLDLAWQGKVLEGARVYPPEAYRAGFFLCLLFTGASFVAALAYREGQNP